MYIDLKVKFLLGNKMFPCRYWLGDFGVRSWNLPGYIDRGQKDISYPRVTYRTFPWIMQGPLDTESLTHLEEDMRFLQLLTTSLRMNWNALEMISNKIPRTSRLTVGQALAWELYQETGLVSLRPVDTVSGRPDTKERPRVPPLTALKLIPPGFTLSEGPVVLCDMNMILTMPLEILIQN